ncbi:MAG: 50S ribosomal protein L22, partial [Acidaminococcaceae bacterium]|nr:50S ribosomal protein L22 [Acidaminococcaceae bacterium]
MEVNATAKYIRIAPRKLRIVMNLIRGKKVSDAFAILKFTPKVGSEVVEKVLRSAVANAE